MLSKEASSIIFLSLWYDSTWDWTPVSQTIGEHSIHLGKLFATGTTVVPRWLQPSGPHVYPHINSVNRKLTWLGCFWSLLTKLPCNFCDWKKKRKISKNDFKLSLFIWNLFCSHGLLPDSLHWYSANKY